jgi:asparagine synthase (glutamine-hydrolysing)
MIPHALRRGILDPIIKGLPEVRSAGLWVDRLKRFAHGADLPFPQRYQSFLAAFDEQEKSELFSEDVRNALRRSGNYLTQIAMERVGPFEDPLEWMLFADMDTYLPGDELRKTDRLSMWHSLEVRVPFLDHKVVEFAASIPSKYKINGMTKKYVLVKALEGLLPQSILARRKQGFSIPLSDWLRGPLREMVHDHLSPESLKRVGLFNVRAVENLVHEHEGHIRNHETKLWLILNLVLWYGLYMHQSTSVQGTS